MLGSAVQAYTCDCFSPLVFPCCPQVAYLKDALDRHFCEKLLRVVPDMLRVVLPETGRAEYQYPERPGSHMTQDELGPPALAFVRALTQLMGLDAKVADDVALLKRRLLKVLHVGEFSAEAEFREPCLSFTLRDVICSFCNDCRDLDLCR